MDRDEFWSLIESACSGLDTDDRADAVQEALEELPAEEIISFDTHFHELMAAAYTWRLWGAAYLINGGCSDDGFDYFRGWLIARGRKAFELALSDPDSLAGLPEVEEDIECEDILNVAHSAYESVAGKEIPATRISQPDLGESWDFDDEDEMRSRYPKLFARFCSD
jgi:hypothetical protein